MIKLKKDDTRPPAAQKGGPAMAGTKKLYYKDAYLREFCARVLSVSYTHLDVYKRQGLSG